MYNMFNAGNTGIVSMPATSVCLKMMDYTVPDNSNSPEFVQSLTGNKISRESFTHNNMTPFLRKNVTQNTNLETMSPFLDNRTGLCLINFGKQNKEGSVCLNHKLMLVEIFAK